MKQKETAEEMLEKRIRKAQEEVSRTKKEYDDALETLGKLLSKREEIYRKMPEEKLARSQGAERAGLEEFLQETFSIQWARNAVWKPGNGTVDCHFKAEIVLKPTVEAVNNTGLIRMLSENPEMEKTVIQAYFAKDLRDYLDYEFEEYCSEDDYYQPVVEDFEADAYVQEWCGKNGFEVVSCEGDGYDDGYEPSFRL